MFTDMPRKNHFIAIFIAGVVLLLITLACSVTINGDNTKPVAQPTSMSLSATAQPQPQQPTEPSPTAVPAKPTQTPTPDVSFNGITFSYDHSLASGVKPTIVPANPPTSDGPWWGSNPEYVQFDFEGYILQDTFHKPQIMVFPVKDYTPMADYANQTVNKLKDFLANQTLNAPEFPFLPMWNAAQMMHTKVAYLDFKNGKGVRYLSQYGQAAYPINNNGFFYTFQGLTNDGQYYVAAVLPISHPSLPPTGDAIPGGDWSAFEQNFVPYVNEITQKLNSQPDRSYNPNLPVLDAIFQSMKVH
jgi:hypothetical protein